jgi:glutathione S-transferase
MLRVWGRTNSINVQKVLWCCGELDLAHERIDAGGKFGVVDTPEYRARNPNSLVPTIDEDGFTLWESNVIVRYLSHRHGQGRLYPSEVRTRFTAEKWMDWQATTLWPTFRAAFWGLVRTPEEKRDKDAIANSQRETAKILEGLEVQLKKTKFAASDSFTMADIPLGVSLYRCLALGIERAAFPNIARWYDRVAERPAFQKHAGLPIT